MDFHQKQAAYQELKGAQYLEADRILLEKLRPSSKILKALKNPDRIQVQEKILWELLDVASPEEIRTNRGNTHSGSELPPAGNKNQASKKKRTSGTGKARNPKGASPKGKRISKD